jgi:hypothetical protein
MTLPGLVAAKNLADVTDRERAWDNLGLNIEANYLNLFDEEARAYIVAVQTADGQALEPSVQFAINNFVVGCKQDGIWTAIKASCILAGARTLTGALVPLVGAAPTNVGGLFVSGDYNRKTGLLGDGSTKYLDTNNTPALSDLDNFHLAAYSAELIQNRGYMGSSFMAGGRHVAITPASTISARFHSDASFPSQPTFGAIPFLFGYSRNNSANFTVRLQKSNITVSQTSTTVVTTETDKVFLATGTYLQRRIQFYSLGESLDLALLDARVTTLINAFAAAIP